MQSAECIEHKGIVEKVGRSALFVNIKSISACADCHAKGACSSFDVQEKIVEVPLKDHQHKVGETVTLTLNTKQGYHALTWGYLIPFFIVLISLIVLISAFNNELLGGLVSLGLLVPYYYWLYQNRNKFKEKFQFKIKD